MAGSGWSPKQRSAIFAAGIARGLDIDGIRSLARERFGISGLRELSREQAHQLLDVLNGKDPARESRKRRYLAGKVRRGERKTARSKARRDGADGPGASAPSPGAEDEGKILRPASPEQWGLLRLIGRRVGLSKTSPSGDGTFVVDLDALARWMRWKLGGAWRVVNWGPRTRRVMPDARARKAIHALRDWEKWRLRKWTEAHGRDVANAVLESGLPNAWDKKLPVHLEELPPAVAAKLTTAEEGAKA